MISSRRPPTFMPTTPLSQPGMTCPAPSWNVKGLLVHDDWTTLPDEYVASTYWTVTLSPGSARDPVPGMRSALSSDVGGVPEGTVTVGAFPAVPAGERSAAGMGKTATRAPPPAAEVDVADWPLLPVVDDVVADPADVEGEELHAARPSAPAAPRASASVQKRGVGEDMRQRR